MGRPGRPKTPSALNALRGNPGKRPLNHDEPQPDLADATPPADLPADALAIWQEYAPQFVATRLLTVVDRRHLARACRLDALGDRELEAAERDGLTSASPANGETVSATFTAALKAFEAADKIWFRFGVTPSERARLKTGPPRERDQNPLEKLQAKKQRALAIV